VNGSFTSVIRVTGEEAPRPMFDPALLHRLEEQESKVPLPPGVTPSTPGQGLRLRPLEAADHTRGFLELLGQLTTVGEVSAEAWEQRFAAMEAAAGTYFVLVVEDLAEERVVGAATLVAEKKFIHGCGQVGRVEDVVVSDQHRGRQLGKLLVASCALLAARVGCYKVTLNCADPMVKFYTSLGFACEQGNANYMCVRLAH